MSCYLHFTISPVQGFVGSSRRTRDLFSGSFILSHLAFTAMEAAQRSQGVVILPDFENLKGIVDKSQYAAAPNRFVVKFTANDTAVSAAKSAEHALRTEWGKIAQSVWDKFVEQPAAVGNDTLDIWTRQVENFWELAWVLADSENGACLDARKNWRTPPLTEEPGDHCTLMANYQELSGWIRSHPEQKTRQNEFWDSLRIRLHNKLNLEVNERLCAISTIKRFFPEVAKDILGHELNKESWPSTVELAVTPFRRKASTHSEYYRFSKNPEWLNRTYLENAGDEEFGDASRDALLKALKNIESGTNDSAGSFYALLLMDGDNMGKNIREHGAELVTSGLTKFAGSAPGLISKNGGTCVYAGGDDVLALFPLDKALTGATEIAKVYKDVFEHKDGFTISAAVVFAQHGIALRQVLRRAHKLLDDVAKERAGRDAIAISIIKPSGESAEWASKFQRFITPASNRFSDLTSNFDKGDASLGSSYLYNLRQRFVEVLDNSNFSKREWVALFTAEFLNGMSPEKVKTIKPAIQPLMQALYEVCVQDDIAKEGRETLTFDGPRIVKFLALDGKEGNR